MSDIPKKVAAWRFSFPNGRAYSVMMCCTQFGEGVAVGQIRASSGGKFKVGSTFTSECPYCKTKFKIGNLESL